MDYIKIKNNQTIPVSDIPEVAYRSFFDLQSELIHDHDERHCVNYFGYKINDKIKLICCIADDDSNEIYVSSCLTCNTDKLQSLTIKHLGFEKFEREIHENFGIDFTGHTWLKPVRYAFNRADQSKTIANYPFFKIESEELHEVGVGPIHAGIIEPGHFRFICNGEQILHLEIQLGYQHRGLEQLFLEKKKLKERTTLAENIAGDTVVGHTTAFSNLWESLNGFHVARGVDFQRTLALELERIAVHTGDLSAACADIAYQLGASVFGRLRTPIINFSQEWCGNRLAKTLIYPGYTPFEFTPALAEKLKIVLQAFEPDFNEMSIELFKLPSAISRFERTGIFSLENAIFTGTVGMAARASGLRRDIRLTHAFSLYPEIYHNPIIKRHGDVYSRIQIRKHEIRQSIGYIRKLLENIPEQNTNIPDLNSPKPNAFTLSLVEGWRGEICHCAITDAKGDFVIYKIKDPSFHNWLALALAVRNNEISDFPICNKSFNLSYCGHDL